MGASVAHYYKLPISVNPSVWFRSTRPCPPFSLADERALHSDVIYGETVLEFGYGGDIVRSPGVEQLMQFFSCTPVAASMLKWRVSESAEEATKVLKVR